MPKNFYKHKLLLDENMPDRSYFPRLNHNFDVKHIKLDFSKEGLPDPEVYEFATTRKRITITLNWIDFVELAETKNSFGVIGVGGKDWSRMDAKLTSLLKKHTASYFRGKLRTLGQEEARLG